MDIFTTASDWILGFFIFLWRSPAFSDAPAWAQAIALLITGLAAVHAAGKAYQGATVQANATRDQVRTAIALHQQTLNREEEREASEICSIAAALAAEILIVVMEINQVRQMLKHNNTSGARGILESSPREFPIYDSNPINVAKLGVNAATSVVGTYNEFRTQVRYWSEKAPTTDIEAAVDELATMKTSFDALFRDAVTTIRKMHRVAQIAADNPFERWFVDQGLDQDLEQINANEA